MMRLVCIDVDGTLVGTGGAVSPGAWAAAERVRRSGVHLAICSGRPGFGLAREYAGRLDPEGWHVFQNGASILHLPSGASRSQPLPAELVERMVARARETGRVLELYTDADYAVESTADRARRHAGLLGVPFRPRDLESLPGTIVRAQWVMAREDVGEVLAEDWRGLHLSLSVSPVMPDTQFINVTRAGVDKAGAVGAVAEAYGVPLAEVMMVGDGLNDLEVVRAVGFGVAMGNAEPELREAARFQVGDVDRGGLAEALELALSL